MKGAGIWALALLALAAPAAARQAGDAALEERVERALAGERHGEAIAALRELAARREAAGDALGAADLVGRIGECYLASSCLADAIEAFSARLERLRRLLGEGDREELARAMNDLGSALLRDGRSAEALPLLEQALAMRRRLDPRDRPELATALSNLAFCLGALERGPQAVARAEEALAMTTRLFGGESPEAALALGNLATSLQATGRAGDALGRFERALALLEATRGVDDPDRARALGGLASCLDALGRHEEALPLHREALARRRALHAQEHPELVASLNNLAGCLDSLGQPSEALPLFQEALATARRLYDGDHPQVALCLNNVGAALQELGRYGEALHLLESALDAWRRMEPGDHPALADSLEQLALCFAELGEREEALPLFEQALAMRRRLYRGDHPDVALANARLARCLRELGRAEEALPLFESALAMRQRIAPGDSRQVAQSLNDFASCLDALGAGEQALAIHESALAMWQRLLGEQRADELDALVGAASCLRCLGRGNEALATYGEALAVVRRDGSEGLQQFAVDLARLLVDDLGRPEEALPVLEEAIGELEHLPSEERVGRGVGAAFETMVRAQVALGRDAQALAYAERARALGLPELLAGPATDALGGLEELALERGDARLAAEVGALRRELEANDAELAALERAREATLAAEVLDELELARVERELTVARACRRDALRRRAAVLTRGLEWSEPLEPAALQALLEPDERALVFSLSEVVGFVFVVPPTGAAIRSFALVWPDGEPVRREELARRVDEYLRALGMSALLAGAFGEAPAAGEGGPRARRHADLGHELFQALIPAEAWQELRRARAVRVVPDGALRRLPLEALVLEPARTLAASTYWLDAGPGLSYVPSASVLAWCRSRRGAPPAVAPAADEDLSEGLFGGAAAWLHAGAPAARARLWPAATGAQPEPPPPRTLADFDAARRELKRRRPEPLDWAAFVALGDPR